MLGFIAARRKGMTARRDQNARRQRNKERAERRRALVQASLAAPREIAAAASKSVNALLPKPSPPPSPLRGPPNRRSSREIGMVQTQSLHYTGFWKYQGKVKVFYHDKWVQYFVAGLIMANFTVNVIEKQIDPTGKLFPATFKTLEDAFNLIFLAELLVNAYGHWLRSFWCSSWNVFDFVVVCVGCISLSWFNITLPGPLSLLRTLRAFRVFRLFKRIPSLNKIIVALAAAIPGTLNAFVVLFLFVSIYAILGVEFFFDFGAKYAGPGGYDADGELLDPHIDPFYDPHDPSSCWYYSLHRPWVDPSTGLAPLSRDDDHDGIPDLTILDTSTGRGACFGKEYFGTFIRSWYSLFQALTCESWAEVIGRPIIFHWPKFLPQTISFLISALYFLSYLLLTWLLLSNVVVSVLLDRFISAGMANAEQDQDHTELDDRYTHMKLDERGSLSQAAQFAHASTNLALSSCPFDVASSRGGNASPNAGMSSASVSPLHPGVVDQPNGDLDKEPSGADSDILPSRRSATKDVYQGSVDNEHMVLLSAWEADNERFRARNAVLRQKVEVGADAVRSITHRLLERGRVSSEVHASLESALSLVTKMGANSDITAPSEWRMRIPEPNSSPMVTPREEHAAHAAREALSAGDPPGSPDVDEKIVLP